MNWGHAPCRAQKTSAGAHDSKLPRKGAVEKSAFGHMTGYGRRPPGRDGST